MQKGNAVLIFIASFLVGVLYHCWPEACLCHIPGRLDGRVAVIADGTSFMGMETISELARRGATVLIGCQSRQHFDILRDKILQMYGENGENVNLDFADEEVKKDLTPIKESQLKFMPVHLNALASVAQFARDIMQATDRLDYLINNAVVSHSPYHTTVDNFESTMGIGHLAHYYLTELLSPLLRQTKPGAKIIIISSAEHSGGSFVKNGFFIPRDKFNSFKALGHVKLANVIHGIILGRKLKGTSVVPASIHPGYVLPDFGIFIPSIFGAFFKSHWEAGQSVLHAILSTDLQPGGYYTNCKLTDPTAEAMNPKVIQFVRAESDRFIKSRTESKETKTN